MLSAVNELPSLWTETPLIRSSHISDLLGCSAYLKLENFQPSQSFKFRGISLFAQQCKQKYGPSVHLVVASSGNAGLAAACAANLLKLRCTVYIPEGVSQRTLNFLKKEHSEVVIKGKYYSQSLQEAEAAVQRESNAVIVPAYNDPVIWQGHSSMIHEIERQISDKPDAIFCSVGGGGLLGGVLVGCKDVGWDDVPVITLETYGSDCFYHSVSVNAGQFNSEKMLPHGIETWHDEKENVNLARIKNLTSRATSLGATSPSPRVVKMALERQGGIKCVCVPDELTMQTANLFAEDHKMLVELACSATLAPAYKPSLFNHLVPSPLGQEKNVVFVVCGGFKIDLEEMAEYREIVREDKQKGEDWGVVCNGEKRLVEK